MIDNSEKIKIKTINLENDDQINSKTLNKRKYIQAFTIGGQIIPTETVVEISQPKEKENDENT